MSLAPLWGGNRGAGAPSMPGPPPAASGAPGAQAAQPPPAAAAHGWTEHKAPDGRTYYFHKAKGVSAWEKPDEMKTEQEKVVAAAMQGIVQSKWKEYTSATGKKVTQWSMPDEMKAAADAAAANAAAEAPAGAPAAAAGAAAGVVAEAAAAPPPRSLASTRSKGSLTNLVRSSKALLAKKNRAQPEDRSRREDV